MSTPVRFTPWRSIRDGAVAGPEAPRNLAGAMESPCATCRTAPCCTHLTVHSFRMFGLDDLAYATYLLNFDRIRLGLNRNGNWSVYYVQPCRYLDRDTFGCTIHDTPQQPQICVQYNPYTCWYRTALTTMAGSEFLLFDRIRLETLARHMEFDDARMISAMPGWDETAALIADLSDPPYDAPEPPLEDGAYTAWQEVVLGTRPAPAPRTEDFTFAELRDPCTGYAAPCCDTLSFPQGRPNTLASVDFLRFALGFPGVELLLHDDDWFLVVKSRCRHLQGGRCAVYGKPERPLPCRYYDAWNCTYRHEFGFPVPEGSLRIRHEHMDALLETIRFDAQGGVTAIPAVEVLRSHVEQRWRDAVTG